MNMWFLYPILAAFLFSTVNYLDKFIIEKISGNRGIGSLVIFSALAGIPVVLILSIFNSAEVLNIDARNAFLMILAGMFYLIGVIFYLYSIWEEDVSSVLPQMLLMPVISIILGYLFLGESLYANQIIGGLLILIGSSILTSSFKSLKHSKAKIFLFVLGASFFVSLNQIIFKYGVMEDVSFWGAIYWEHLGFLIMALLIFLFVPTWRKDFFKILKKRGKLAISANSLGEVINIVGNSALHYGTLLAPVGLVSLITEGTQPLFLLIGGIILTKFFPQIIKEDITRKTLLSKIGASIIMFIGLMIIG